MVDKVFWGAFFLVCVAITTPLNIVINYIIFRMPSLKHRPALRIMLSLSLAELGQLLNSVCAALRLILHIEVSHTFIIFFSIINNGFWCLTLFNHVLLVIDRLFVIFNVSNLKHDRFHRKMVDISILIIWIAGFSQTLIWHFCGPYVYFDFNQMRWNPRTDLFISKDIDHYFTVFNIFVNMFGVVGTVIIFMHISYRRLSGESSKLPKRLEFQILIQNTLILSCALISMYPQYFIPFVEETIRTNVLNVVLICSSPYLYLILSRDIRFEFLGLFFAKYKKYSSSMVFSIGSNNKHRSPSIVPLASFVHKTV